MLQNSKEIKLHSIHIQKYHNTIAVKDNDILMTFNNWYDYYYYDANLRTNMMIVFLKDF